MTSFQFPYKVPKSELSDELSSIGFQVENDFISEDVASKIDDIIVLSGGTLHALKMKKAHLSPRDSFVVIEGCEVPRDITEEVGDNKHIILSMMNPFQYHVGDCYEPHKPSRGDSYISFVAEDKFTEVDALFLALSFSYLFGTKFDFFHDDVSSPDYVLTFDKSVPTRKQILDALTKHGSEIEKENHIKDFKVIRRYTPPFKPIDDFE